MTTETKKPSFFEWLCGSPKRIIISLLVLCVLVLFIWHVVDKPSFHQHVFGFLGDMKYAAVQLLIIVIIVFGMVGGVAVMCGWSPGKGKH